VGPDRLLKKSASDVLAMFRGSTYGTEYASPLLLLRPCWTAFLNSLLVGLLSSVIWSLQEIRRSVSIFQQSARGLCYTGFRIDVKARIIFYSHQDGATMATGRLKDKKTRKKHRKKIKRMKALAKARRSKKGKKG
jgi:hypothetical protein